MTTTSPLRAIIEHAARELRRDALIAIAAVACALIPVTLLVGWLVGGWPRPSVVPLLLEALFAIAAAVFLLRARRIVHAALDETAVTRAAEARLSLPSGSLRGALELDRALPAGASPALAQRSERLLARELAAAPPQHLTGDLGDSWRRKRLSALSAFGALTLVVLFVGFVTPDRSRAAWAPLLHPVRNLRPPALPVLEVLPGNATVSRGGNIDVRVRAPQRAAVTLHWRVQGDIARAQVLTVLRDTVTYGLQHLDGATEYWVEAPDGAASEHFTITPVDPLLLSELAAEIVYPAYLNRANDHYDGELPALEIPEGTELMLRGRATRTLSRGSLVPDSGTAIPLRVDDAGFNGRWVPQSSGVYAWQLRDRAGSELAVQPPPIAVSIVRDLPPVVLITFPGVDTVFGPELELAVAADAQDDHGVANATLVTWRVSRTGAKDAPVETPLALNAGDDRVVIHTVLDASERGLTAGDTLKYFVRVRDDSPRGQATESITYAIRLPGMNELRDAADAQTQELIKQNDALAKAAAKLQEETRNTQRRTAAANARKPNGGQGGTSPSQQGERMQFAESQAAQKVLDQQQQMLKDMEAMRAKVDQMQKSLENAGLQDGDLQKQLDELRKLYDQALTPELRQKMEQLKRALDKLDPQDVDSALQDLAKQQEQMKQQLERTMELMRRAAAEQEMNKLTQETKELAQQQEALARSMPDPKTDPKTSAAQQKDLAQKNGELSKEIDALREQLQKQGEAKAAEQTAKANESAKSAQESMQQAAQQSAAQQQSGASEQAKQAAQKLNATAEQLDKARQDMIQGWKDEVQESMQQATRDALSLAQRQQALKDQMEKNGQQDGGRGAQMPQPPQVPQPQVGKSQEQGRQGGPPQPGQQQGGKPQQGQQGQQGGQGGDKGTGQQQGGQQQGGQQAGGQPGQQQGPPQAGQPGGSPGQGGSQNDLAQMRSEQAALQQGLQQLGRNLQETGDRSAMVNRDVGSSLSRANQSMQQTQDALQNAQGGQMPSQQAGQAVDDLNKLALSLLKNSQQVQESQNGTGAQQMMQRMAELAKQQGSVNGQGSSLLPMQLSGGAMSDQVRKLGQSQQQIAKQLDEASQNPAGKDILGKIDELAKEAAAIAAEMQTGRLQPQTLARQEKLFHRLLDAGRSLEKDEVSQERVAERPVGAKATQPDALDPKLFQDGTRFRVPTPDELRALPPAYRKLILDYFERLNKPAPPDRH
jgi:hypothetical protein